MRKDETPRRTDGILDLRLELNTFFFGLQLKETSSMAWKNMQATSLDDVVVNVGDVKDELGNQEIRIFLQHIQECRTRLVGIIPQMIANFFIYYYQVVMFRRLQEELQHVVRDASKNLQLSLYLCIPWVGRNRRASEVRRLPRNLRKIVRVETQLNLSGKVFIWLKIIIKGSQVSEKFNTNHVLEKKLEPNSPLTDQVTIDAIKMHEVMERSLKIVAV